MVGLKIAKTRKLGLRTFRDRIRLIKTRIRKAGEANRRPTFAQVVHTETEGVKNLAKISDELSRIKSEIKESSKMSSQEREQKLLKLEQDLKRLEHRRNRNNLIRQLLVNAKDCMDQYFIHDLKTRKKIYHAIEEMVERNIKLRDLNALSSGTRDAQFQWLMDEFQKILGEKKRKSFWKNFCCKRNSSHKTIYDLASINDAR